MRSLHHDYMKDLIDYYDSFENALMGDDEDNAELLHHIQSKYDLTPMQAKILGYLSKFYPSRIVEFKFQSLFRDDDENYLSVIYDLVNRKFIDASNTTNGTTCYKLNDMAREAISKGNRYDLPPVKDVMAELNKAEGSICETELWIERMMEGIDNSDDEEMKSGIAKLNIKNLSDDAKVAFWKLIIRFVKHFTSPLAFVNDSISSGEDTMDGSAVRRGCVELVKLGISCSMPIEPHEDTHETDRYVLAPKVVEYLFYGKHELVCYEEISRHANVILSKDITEKELFFTEESQEEVDNLRYVLSHDGFNRAKTILKRQKRNPAVHSLFFGPPGTGKTEVIKQIARETGRDLIIFDAAKVTASAWGASEKNYRSLFLAYNYIAAVSDNVPILMFNEADAILAKRIKNTERSIDRAENYVSNILLQAFEDMSGILLATTNLASNIDEAFERRFLFKTQLSKPDAAARKKIWKSLIPELNDSDISQLANNYNMSGGQISNVVTKRDLAELYYEGDRGLAYISNLCKLELLEPIKGTGTRRVGF